MNRFLTENEKQKRRKKQFQWRMNLPETIINHNFQQRQLNREFYLAFTAAFHRSMLQVFTFTSN